MESIDDTARRVVVTRQELYRQVWEMPMSRLAERYGITGTGLAKICLRLNIPRPARGYWAKKAAGKKTAIPPLPAKGKTTPEQVTIAPTPQPPQAHAHVREQVDEARARVGAIAVSERLMRPHPIVAGWLSDRGRSDREVHRDRWRGPDRGKNDALSETDLRRYRILDALFKELERRGGHAKRERHGDHVRRQHGELFVEIQGEQIAFRLREKLKQVRRPPRADDRPWDVGRGGLIQELHPTGHLVFIIETYLEGKLRREWLESDDRRMEMMLGDVVATLFAAAPLLAESRRRREEEARQRELAEQRYREEQDRLRQERNRWRRFVEIAHRWREAQIARDFLKVLKMAEVEPLQEIAGSTATDWIAWAEGRLADTDPLQRGTEAIFSEVGSVTYRD